MKRMVLCLLCFLLAAGLFSACESTPEQNTESTTEMPTTTAPTEEPTEETAEEPTTPAKPEIGQLWHLDRSYPSYDDYFAQRVRFPEEEDLCRWIAGDGNTNWTFEAKLNSKGLSVCGEAFSNTYPVPESGKLFQDYDLAAADGSCAILIREDQKQLLQVDLLTGDTAVLLSDEEIVSLSVPDHNLAYYLVKRPDSYEVCMLFIPEQRVEVLCRDIPAEQLEDQLSLVVMVKDNYEPVSLVMYNPRMYQLLKKEFMDPESRYKTNNPNGWDFSDSWGEAALADYYSTTRNWVAYWIQEDTGIDTYLSLKIYWDGTVQEIYSVIDMCWFGTGLNHDHSNPDAPRPAPIDPIPGEWSDMEPFLWESDVQKVQDIQCFDGNIYILASGEAKQIAMGEILWKQETDRGLFFATTDGRIVRIDQDVTLLYDSAGEKLRLLNTDGTTLVFIQGNDLMEADLENMRIRCAISHEDLDYVYFWDYEEPAQIVIEIVSGLYVEQYLLTVRGDRWEETTFI